MSLNKNDLMDAYLLDYLELYPSFNTFIGLPELNHYKQYYENSLSPESQKQAKDLYQKYVKLMKKQLSSNVNSSKYYWQQSFIQELETNLKLLDSPDIYMPITHLENTIIYYIDDAVGNGLYQFENKQDYDWFISRTQQFEVWCQTAITRMKEGIQKKYILPKFSVSLMINQLKNSLKARDYMEHKLIVKLDYDFLKEIDNILQRIISNMITFLENIYIKHTSDSKIGYSHYPGGKSWYRKYVTAETGLSDLTVPKIHKLGLQEVERIYNSYHQLMEKLGFEGTYQEFAEHLDKQSKLKFKSENEMKKTYLSLRTHVKKNIMSKLFVDKLKQDSKIIPVPKYLEEGSPAGYYMPGDVINKRVGKFYYNAMEPTKTNKYEAKALYLHEDIPGHHYQITLTNLNKKIPLFIKLLDNNAYIEGWGLYVENLGDYDDYEYIGKLNFEMLRALRLVVDTGIHHYGWSMEKVFNYFNKYALIPEKERESEIYRYIVLPAQALSYKIGELAFLDLRQKWEEKGLSVVDFHHQILNDGALPLEIIKQKIENILGKK